MVILVPDELCKLNLAISTYHDNIAYESLNWHIQQNWIFFA